MENREGPTRGAAPDPRRTDARRVAASGRRHSPTREMLLRMVEAQGSAVSTAALTAASGLHENTVRGHLEQLYADGYVRRERENSTGRGRPAWLWTAVTPEPANPYIGLAAALAATLARTSTDPVAQARDAGRAWGAQIAATHAADRLAAPREVVVDVMREQGFAPTDTGQTVVLRRCPLIEAATRYPDIVCAVHQGMIDGILQARGSSARSRLIPFSAPGECTLHLQAAQ
ncbi:helix-turn-helix transcriptional regulator [Microbacterium luticocti]|uniref:helix-turn-helix transcriptional regulator n=1 Tax=Microbacterium luticocti TaxID=451764 RepID=UPI000688209F|nr:transcriptional regulator [Microbacterium luticocti]